MVTELQYWSVRIKYVASDVWEGREERGAIGGMMMYVGRWPKREERLRNGWREEIHSYLRQIPGSINQTENARRWSRVSETEWVELTGGERVG